MSCCIHEDKHTHAHTVKLFFCLFFFNKSKQYNNYLDMLEDKCYTGKQEEQVKSVVDQCSALLTVWSSLGGGSSHRTVAVLCKIVSIRGEKGRAWLSNYQIKK